MTLLLWAASYLAVGFVALYLASTGCPMAAFKEEPLGALLVVLLWPLAIVLLGFYAFYNRRGRL